MSFQMTERVVKSVNEEKVLPIAQALNFVCGALLAYDGAEGKSPYDGLDVERVFAAVDLLARRRDLEVTPFVASWHPAVETWDRPDVPAFWDNQFKKAIMGQPASGSPQRLITNLVGTVTGGGSGRVYERLMERLVHHLVGLLSTSPDRVDYLAPLVEAGRADGITIATLNYDLTLEQAAHRQGVECHTGIQDWGTDANWRWPTSGVSLLKLHGSINWEWEERRAEPDSLSTKTVALHGPDTEERWQRRPALVFGHGAKLRAEGPFLSLLGQFEQQLRQHSQLVVIGYSFRDDHINELIRRWLTDDLTRQLSIVDPCFPERTHWSERPAFADELTAGLMAHDWPGREREVSGRLAITRKTASEAIAASF